MVSRRENQKETPIVMKATDTRKMQIKKPNYMNDEALADLKQALEDALAFERGEIRDLHVTRIRVPRSPKDKMEPIEGISCSMKSIKA